MSFPIIGEKLDLGDVFFVFLNAAGVNTHCRKFGATTTPLALSLPRTSLLVIQVLLASLALVGRRLLVLTTRCISKRSVNGLSPSGVFLSHKPIPLRIL